MYGCSGASKIRSTRRDLHELAGVEHARPVAQLRDHAQVVRDQDDGGAVPVAQVADERQDLGLDRDVERGGRLVGDEQRRLVGERGRDHDALLHAAAQAVRRVAVALRRGRDPDLGEELRRPLAGLAAAHRPVGADRLGDLLADRERRVERRLRVLEHHADPVAAQPPPGRLGEGEDVLALEVDPPAHLRRGAGAGP